MASYTLPTSKNIWNFDPTSIGGCTMWLDAADSSTLFSDTAGTIPATNGGNVSRWNDKSISRISAIVNNNTNSYNTIYGTTPPTLGTDPNSGRSALNFGVGVITLTATTSGTNVVTVTNPSFTLSAGQHIYVSSNVGGLNVGSPYYVFNPSGTPTTSFQVVSNPLSTTPVTLTTTTSQNIPVVISSAPLILPYGSHTVTIPINTTTSTLTVVYPPTVAAPVNYMLPAVGQTVNFTSTGSISGINTGITYFITSVSGTVGTSLTFTVSTTPGGTNSSFTLGGTASNAGVSIGRGTFLNGQQDCTMFVVARTTHASNSINSTSFSYGTYAGYAARGINSIRDNAQVSNGTSVVQTGISGVQFKLNITSGTFNNSIQSGWLNGTPFNGINLLDLQLNGGNWQTGTVSAQIGAFMPAYPMFGQIAEILYYNTALSNTDRQIIEGYLAWKWGLANSLPSSHPYYSLQLSSDGIPLSISSACNLWLDGSDVSTMFTDNGATIPVTTNNQTVQYWRDKSGNSADVQGPISDPGFTGPIYSTNSQYSRSTLVFNGTNYLSMLSAKIASMPNGSSPASYFIVSQTTLSSPASPQMIFTYGAAPTAINSMRQYYYGVGALQNQYIIDLNQNGRINSGTALTNTYGILSNTMTNTSTGNIGFTNGSSFTTNNGNLTTMNTGTAFCSIGSGLTTGTTRGFFLTGNVAEIIVYTGVISTVDRQRIEGYLAWKWGLQASLPSTHPYALANYFYTSTRPFSRTFVPTDVSNCIMWYDGADMSSMFQNTAGTTPVTGTGQTIALWRDKSGSGNNLTSTAGPTYTATPLNPRGFNVSFNGTTQFMSNTALVNNSNTYTKFLVFQRSNIASDFCRFFAYATVAEQNTSDPTGFHIQAAGNGTTTIHQLYKSNGGSGSFTLTNNVYIIATIVANPLTMSLFLNGSLTATATVGPLPNTNFNATRFFLARTTLGTFQFFPGIINEVISYNRQLSTYEYQEVEGYLAWKWGMRASLPTTHPFFRFPTPSITPVQPELQLYKPQFDPSDLNPTIWLDSSDSTTLTTSNNRVTGITSKGSQTLTLAPPNLPFSIIIPSSTTVPTGGTGTTFIMNGTMLGVGTLSGITVTVGGTAIPNCTLTGGSATLITGSTVTISNGAAVTAATFSIGLQASTTIPTGGTATTSFTMNLAPTGTGTLSGVPLVIGGAYIQNCTLVGGSTTLTTGASTTIANGSTVLVQPGPILNTATRGTGLSRPYMDFSSGGNFALSAASIGNYNSTAVTITANSVYLDGTTIIISSSPAVTLTLNQPIVFNGSGTVIPGTTNIVAGTTYFIRAVTIFSATNTNFPTFAITVATSSGGTAITGLTAGTLTGVTATAGAYLLTLTTSLVHNITNGSPVTLILDSNNVGIAGTFFGNIQSVPSATQLTIFVTSSSTTITSQTISQLVGHVQYANNPIIGGSLAGDGTTLTLTTAMPHNLQVGHVVQPYFGGPSLPSQWSPYTQAIVYSSNPSNATFTGYISGDFLIPGTSGQLLAVTAGTPPAVGAVLSGAGITPGTYVSGVFVSNKYFYVNVAQNVSSTTITSTYSYITFVGNLSGTTLTFVSGTVPSLGMVLSGAGIGVGTYIVSGGSGTYTLSTSVTTGTSIAITASNYAVEIQLPSTNWPPIPAGLNNGGTVSITSTSGSTFSGINLGTFATVGQLVFLTSAVGSVSADAYYVASKPDSNSITLARSRDLTTIVSPGTTSGINVVLYNPGTGLRFCSAGTSSISTLNYNGNSALVGADYSTRRITVSGFMVTSQPVSGVVNMALVANPGIQASGSGSFAFQYVSGTYRVLSIPTTTTLTISLAYRGSSQAIGSVTYTGLMANYGFTDFRFGGNGLGSYSFGGWNPTQSTQALQAYSSTVTQAYLSYPAIGCILEATGSSVTNSFNSTLTTAIVVTHSTTTPLRSGASNPSFAPSLLSTSVTSGAVGGTNTTSGGRDFSILPSLVSQGLAVQLVHNNLNVNSAGNTNIRPGSTLDWTSGYRIYSVMFNSTGSAMGDVATLTRYLTTHGWRCDANASFANNTSFFTGGTIASNTSLAPTVLRLGASPSVIGYGIDSITYCDMGISEILIFNTIITLEQRQLVEGFLSQKYASQYILANGSTTVSSSTFIHPYRTNPTTITPSLNLANIYAQGLAAWFDAANASTIEFVSGNFVNSWVSAGGNLGMNLSNTVSTSTWWNPVYDTDSAGRWRVRIRLNRYSVTTKSVDAANGILLTSTSIVPAVDQGINFGGTIAPSVGAGGGYYIKTVTFVSGNDYIVTLSGSIGGTTLTFTANSSLVVNGNIIQGNTLQSTSTFSMGPQLTTQNSNNEFTNILVFSRDGSTGSTGYILNYASAGNSRFTIQDNRYCDYNLNGGGITQPIAYSSTTLVSNIPYILISYRRGSTNFTRLIGNNTTVATTAANANNLTIPGTVSLRMGAYANVDASGYGNQFGGSIYEHMLFKYAMTDQAIYQMEGYLAWKWGLRTSLPTTHPYYRIRP